MDCSPLVVDGLDAGYGRVTVVRGLTMHLDSQEVVLLLGANGAGKSTTVMTVAGALPPLGGKIIWRGKQAVEPLHVRVRSGLGVVPETRSIISKLTVFENLRIGPGPVERALELFPELHALRNRKAGLVSGGEQRMLSLGRALAAEPDVLLADELSLGLAPLVVSRLLKGVREAADRGAGVLLVEQHVRQALKIADRVYVMRRGALAWEGTAAEARARPELIEGAYLGQ